MFTKELYDLTLARDNADVLFPHICADTYGSDRSFTATLRALLHSRVATPDTHPVYVERGRTTYERQALEGADKDVIVMALVRTRRIVRADARNIVYVHDVDSLDGGGNDITFDSLDCIGKKCFVDFSPMPDMDQFMKQKKMRARFFHCAERNCTMIFIERLDMKKWHLLQAFIPRYFPSYFADKPLEEREYALIKSLKERYAPAYEALIEEFAAQFDFRTLELKQKLCGFETRFERAKLREVRDRIERYRNVISDLERQFAEYYRKVQESTTEELGLIEKISSGGGEESNETLDYFLCNKGLHLQHVDDGAMEFIVTTTISNFDPDQFEAAIKKPTSFFYRHYETREGYGNPELTDERIKRLMIAIFRDEICKLRVCAAYYLDFANGNYQGQRAYGFPDYILRDHTPNQHIQYYACLGDNRAVIRNAIERKDYVAAIGACCASAGNMNLSESNTGTYFMQKICATNAGKIIQMPDGTTMTPVEAVKWLEAQDAEK